MVKTVLDPVLPKRLKTSLAGRIAEKLPESAKASGPGIHVVTSGERVWPPVTGDVMLFVFLKIIPVHL